MCVIILLIISLVYKKFVCHWGGGSVREIRKKKKEHNYAQRNQPSVDIAVR